MAPEQRVRRTAFASTLGTVLEYYDFFIYGTAAALLFNKLFFPTVDPLVGTLAAFATYAVAFLARPLGGLVFGHFGDRLGRKRMLVITIVMTGLGTFLVGLMPTYETIGIWAPILLVTIRLVQGFGVGGEQGGAVLLTCETAPAERRGFYGSLVQLGAPAGFLLPAGLFALLTRRCPRRRSPPGAGASRSCSARSSSASGSGSGSRCPSRRPSRRPATARASSRGRCATS